MSSSGSGSGRPPVSSLERDRYVDHLIGQSRAAHSDGHFENAAQAAEMATRIAPKNGEAWMLLCGALHSLGSIDLERAITDALRNLGDGHPMAALLNADRARALSTHGRWQEAADLARSTAKRADIAPQQHSMLGTVFSQIALFEEGLHEAQLGAEGQPDSPNAFYALGTALRYLGRSSEAKAAFDRVLELNPGDSLALASLTSMIKAKPDSNHLDILREAIAQKPPPEANARLHHALFKELDDLGRREEAWPALQEGARAASEIFHFDMPDKIARTDALIENFPATAFPPTHVGKPANRPRPIFVLGLPRSGTTITERILAAHSRVTAMGETPSFSSAIKRAVGQNKRRHPSVDDIRAARSVNWSSVAERYLANVAYLLEGADTFTEKTPHNYEFAGLIAHAFPEAAIVHVRRGPMDSLFGTYRLLFGEGGYHWTYSFEDLAENYRQYRRIMDHWRACLGERLIEVKLEDLGRDPERQVRQLLDAVGLSFEEACLTPETNESGVSTASASQVRQPINSQGVGRWRAYASQLEPLRGELERSGFVDAAGDPIWT